MLARHRPGLGFPRACLAAQFSELHGGGGALILDRVLDLARRNIDDELAELERVTGQTLNNNGVSLGEAFQGVVSRPASPLPAKDPQGE